MQAIQDVSLQVQEGMDMVASLGERVKKYIVFFLLVYVNSCDCNLLINNSLVISFSYGKEVKHYYFYSKYVG